MFENILGNDEIKQELTNLVTSNKISHSYLFIGTDGIGKKLIARDFAEMILGMSLENNPDFAEIEPDGTSIKIDQIRNLQKKVLEAPIKANKKIYIIDDADLMTKEAQNCLLKTLEEPPEFVIIILIGAVDNNFLSTIKSRCTILKFQNIPNELIKQYLKEKYNLENISDEMIEIFQGSIKRAEELRNKKELYDSVYNILDRIQELDLIDILKKADIIYKSQDDKFDILEYMNIICFNKAKKDLKYIRCIEIIEETKKRLKANSNYNMCMDNMLFEIWEEIR